jgi:hypothetical protein
VYEEDKEEGCASPSTSRPGLLIILDIEGADCRGEDNEFLVVPHGPLRPIRKVAGPRAQPVSLPVVEAFIILTFILPAIFFFFFWHRGTRLCPHALTALYS